jgi:hypothetical protein
MKFPDRLNQLTQASRATEQKIDRLLLIIAQLRRIDRQIEQSEMISHGIPKNGRGEVGRKVGQVDHSYDRP